MEKNLNQRPPSLMASAWRVAKAGPRLSSLPTGLLNLHYRPFSIFKPSVWPALLHAKAIYSLLLSLKPVTFEQGVRGNWSPAKVLKNVTRVAGTTAGQDSIAEPFSNCTQLFSVA